MTIQDKAELIIKDIKLEKGTNPIQIFKKIAQKEYVSMHGPEHHILDGASLLVAYKNAGGNIDIENALEKLSQKDLRMPGAMCGYGEYVVQLLQLGQHYQLLMGQVHYQQMVHGEIICSLLQRRLVN